MSNVLSKHLTKQGFTLIELVIVIAIIGLMTVFIAFISSVLIERAKVAKAQGDLNRIAKAISQLEIDTGLYPAKDPGENCGLVTGEENEISLIPGNPAFDNNSGLVNNFSSPEASWKGPYIEVNELTKDPWGRFYEYDGDYQCVEAVKGCEDYIGGGTDEKAVFSRGKNGTSYDSDDIVIIFCTR